MLSLSSFTFVERREPETEVGAREVENGREI